MLNFKKKLKRIINNLILLFSRTSLGRHAHKYLLQEAMLVSKKINHKGLQLNFTVPNSLCRYRADTFSTKEPETLEWIDNFEEGSIFWDVGANVGLYSCYAAVSRNCEVISFEPSVFNLELLARNIFVNNLTNQVSIMPLALSDRTGANKFNLTTTEWGGALSTFGYSFGQDGKDLEPVFIFNTFGIPMDQVCNVFKLKEPQYMKIDVDGIEHLILKGGPSVLDSVDEVLIEINDNFVEQSNLSSSILSASGFKMLRKISFEDLKDTDMDKSFNQIWVKERTLS